MISIGMALRCIAILISSTMAQTPASLPSWPASPPVVGTNAQADPKTAEWLRQMGERVAAGQYAEAVEPAQSIYDYYQRTLGPDHHFTLTSKVELENVKQAAALPPEAQAAVTEARRKIEQLMRSSARELEPIQAAIEDALAVVAQHLGPEHPYLIPLLTAGASVARARNDFVTAESTFTRAADIARLQYGERNAVYASIQTYLAGLYLSLGRFSDSIHAAEGSLAIYSADFGVEHPNSIVSMSLLVDGYREIGRYEDALAKATDILRIQEKTLGPKHPQTGIGKRMQGTLLALTGKYAEAEETLRRAVDVHSASADSGAEAAASLEMLANFFASLGRDTEAVRAYKRAFSLRRQAGQEARSEAQVPLLGLAAALARMGAVDEAELALQHVLLGIRNANGSDHLTMLHPLGELARLCEWQGRYAEATLLHRKRLQIASQQLGLRHPTCVQVHDELSEVLPRSPLGQGEVEAFFQEVVTVREATFGPEDARTADALIRLGQYELESGRLSQAKQSLSRALSVYEASVGKRSAQAATAVLLLAGVLDQTDDRVAAVENADLSATTFDQVAGSSDARTIAAWTVSARYHHRLGNRSMAEASIKRALEGTGKGYVASNAMTPTDNDLLAETPYLTACALYLASNRPAEALVSLDQHWNHQWLATRRRCGDTPMMAIDPELRNEESQWATRVRGLNEQIERLRRSDVPSGDAEAELASSEATLAKIRDTIQADPRWRTTASPQPCDLRRLGEQTLKSADEAIIGWLDFPFPMESGDKLSRYAWVLRGGQSSPIWERLKDAMEDPAHEPDGAELYGERIEPMIRHLHGVRRLLVIPTGTPMVQIPLQSLPNSSATTGLGDYVGDRYEIVYAPSLTSLLSESWDRTIESSSTAPDRLGILAVTGAKPGESHARSGVAAVADARLAESEAQGLAALIPNSQARPGSEGEGQQLWNLALEGKIARFSHIHLGNFSYVDPHTPHRSAVMLAQVDPRSSFERLMSSDHFSNGWLDLREILNMRLSAEVVSLTACQTFDAESVPPVDPLILTEAFRSAGADHVLTSLWTVEEEARILLTHRFYENRISRGLNLPNALQQAQRWLRELNGADAFKARQALKLVPPEALPPQESEAIARPFEHPHYWAAFVLVGGDWT